MGYCTAYSFQVPDPGVGADQEHAYMKELADLSGYSYEELWEGTVKWYEHAEHMREFSERHPGVLFELRGEGEEPLDVWTGWARDGLYYERPIEVIYPEFDEGLLK